MYTVIEFAGHLNEEQIREGVKRFLSGDSKDRIAVLSLHALSMLGKELSDQGYLIATSGLLSGPFTESVTQTLLKSHGANFILLEAGASCPEGLTPIFRISSQEQVFNDLDAFFLMTPTRFCFQGADPTLEELVELRMKMPESLKCLLELPIDTVNASELVQNAGFQGLFHRISAFDLEKPVA